MKLEPLGPQDLEDVVKETMKLPRQWEQKTLYCAHL